MSQDTGGGEGRSVPPLSVVPGWLVRSGTAAWMLIGLGVVAVAIYLASAQISGLVAPLVIAVVMGMLFHPLVDRIARHGRKRSLAALIVMLGIALVVIVSIYLTVEGVIQQSSEIAAQLQLGWQQVQEWLLGFGFDTARLEEALSNLGGGLGGGVSSLITATVSSLGVFVIGLFIATFCLYYLLKDWHTLLPWIASHVGLPKDLGTGLIEDATTSIRAYFYALTLTSIPIALVIGATVWLLGLPLAFPIMLVTFVTAYIPYIGAIFSGAFATLVALGSGGVTDALIVLTVVLLTQNVLQALLLTKLSSRQLHIHPIVNLASTIIGATLAGILGATLSAPLVAMVIAGHKRLTQYRWESNESEVPPVPGLVIPREG